MATNGSYWKYWKRPLAIFSRASSQTEQIVTSSYFLIMKRDFYNHLQRQSFNTIDREQIRQPHETFKTIARTARDRSDFCADARPCFERLKGQLDLRFDSKQRNRHNIVRDDQDMVLAMMCDPRVKHHLTSGHQLVSLRIVPNTVSLHLAVASQLLAIKEAHLPFYSAWAQKHHTVSGAAVDLLGTDENDFESLEGISDGEIEDDEDVSTSIGEMAHIKKMRRENDAVYSPRRNSLCQDSSCSPISYW